MLGRRSLSGRSNHTMTPNVFKPAAERMHAGRVRRAQNEGRRSPELEQTLFAATLLFILVLGDSLFAPSVRRPIGLVPAAAPTPPFPPSQTKLSHPTDTPHPPPPS